MKSGQQQIVSVIIVVGLVLGAVATVLPWATSVIQKKKDTKSLAAFYISQPIHKLNIKCSWKDDDYSRVF